MSKRFSKSKRRSNALPALGFAGVSLSMASGACVSISEATASTSPTSSPSQSHEIFLGEEEISDVSLATFYVFDKENAGPPPLAQRLRLARCGGGCGCGGGGGCGCGGHGGCGGGGCGGGGWGGGVRVVCAGGGCGGWHGGCGACRCGGFFFRGCVGCVACGGCGGCGGCSGSCWIWTPLGWVSACWGESTPAAEVSRVASEQIEQTAEASGRGDGNISGTRTK
jgi:hypothetical protein